MPNLLIILGIAGYIASLVIAYVKGALKKQIVFVLVLIAVWLLMFFAKFLAVKAGMTEADLGIVKTTLIELVINYIYPYTIAPLIALLFVILKKK